MERAVPYHYKPRPYQAASWQRRLPGRYDIYMKIWGRQLGKDTDDIQYALNRSWLNPGTQSAYIGLDNKWIRRNIWDKYIDGRRHWDDYPPAEDGGLLVRDTQQQVRMTNNPPETAEALIQFIGFKESESLIGSSYDNFYVSELSLYRDGAFDLIQPIWDNKVAMGLPLSVNFNFTPRGLANIAAKMLIAYTGVEDPDGWAGGHGRTYVDVVPADKATNHDGSRLFSDALLEAIRDRYVRQFGNDNLFRQEYLCEFLAVNAGLVFPAIEILRREKRYRSFNIDPSSPLMCAWDISSKGKESDWTSCVVFQFIDNSLFIYDIYENNRLSVVECVRELAKNDYFHRIRAAALPWDSDRSGSSLSPLAECMREFPNIQWVKLDRTYVHDGIDRVRQLLPNTHINSNKCEWLMDCFEHWEYRELASTGDWAAQPKHDRYSHLMDACRYMADMLAQVPYLKASRLGTKMPASYDAWDEDDDDRMSWDDVPPEFRPSKFSNLRNKRPDEVYPFLTLGEELREKGFDPRFDRPRLG